jgi:hypothetical protein
LFFRDKKGKKKEIKFLERNADLHSVSLEILEKQNNKSVQKNLFVMERIKAKKKMCCRRTSFFGAGQPAARDEETYPTTT